MSIAKPKDTDTKSKTEKASSFTKKVSAAEFKKILNKGNVISLDVRTEKEVSQGKIASSRMIDVFDKNFISKINLLDKSKTIAIYCRSGRRSSIAIETLKKNGFKKIYELKGGIIAWQAKGFKLVKAK